jgi:hypothetical protein
VSDQRLFILRGRWVVGSQQRTEVSPRDKLAALGTSGEVECTVMVMSLQHCDVMGREAVITPLYQAPSPMLRISAERDRGMIRATPLNRPQAIVLTSALKQSLYCLFTLWCKMAPKDTKSSCLSFPDSNLFCVTRPGCGDTLKQRYCSLHLSTSL